MLSALLLSAAVVFSGNGYFASLARHLGRWLRGECVPASVVRADAMAPALKREKIAFLVGFDNPSAADMRELTAFRARGGKLVVFHSASPALAKLMGVKPLGFASAPYPGAWSRMDFSARRPTGFPASVRQTSTVLLRASPLAGGRVLATWSDRRGKSSGEAAWLQTPAGFWMTHVLLADGDEDLKARLCAAMAASADPAAWSAAASDARERAAHERISAFARAQTPRTGEIHAVWDHSGCGLNPGNWPQTMRVLRASHVTDIFVNVAGAGFAHYPSAVLPASKTLRQEGDQLAACVAAAHAAGVRVHAWVLCFTATRSPPDVIARYRRDGWCLKSAKGAATNYLNPANPAVRRHVLSAIDEIQARYAVDGIHLDFVRFYEGAAKPRNAADVITGFVTDARRRVRRPKWLTAAVLGKYPSCVASVGQEWTGWLDANLVDYVVPMDYTEDNSRFAEFVTQHGANRRYARKTIAGIGVTANESRLDAKKVIDQILLSRRAGLAGNALFDLDLTLESRILPYLRLGVW